MSKNPRKNKQLLQQENTTKMNWKNDLPNNFIVYQKPHVFEDHFKKNVVISTNCENVVPNGASNQQKKRTTMPLYAFRDSCDYSNNSDHQTPNASSKNFLKKAQLKPTNSTALVAVPICHTKTLEPHNQLHNAPILNGFAKPKISLLCRAATSSTKPEPKQHVPLIAPWTILNPKRQQKKNLCALLNPMRAIPPELAQVEQMTSAEFRHDYAAHIEYMRTSQKDQEHLKYFETLMIENQHLIKNSTLLVLRCGVGILALMAARLGAARVYAIDYSNVTNYAELVVKANHYEHIIKVIHGKVADIVLPNNKGVDGIICNWMGHSLLYESEIVGVLQARDRWLKTGGFILPDLASLYLLGSSATQLKNERCNYWLDVYGFKMNALRRYSLAEPRYIKVQPKSLLTLAHEIMALDLNKISVRDLYVDRAIQLKLLKEDYLECFVLYFDVEFSRAHKPLKLSCNPCLKSNLNSAWLQTVLFVERPFIMRKEYSYKGHLTFSCIRKEQGFHPCEMNIEIEFYECCAYEHKMLVHKSWNMMQRFQTVREVESCQDVQD